ncbi:MAG TPA: tetratricopeptide repeat protein [Gaiellaceae bacterium]|nr:tetratricopeptide repeat protein [Gaiellaceae bacterium]
MARAAVKAKQAQQRAAKPAKAARRGGGRRRHAGGGNPNQQLFFSRLRRRAKFAYVILAVLFAVTFAFLGIGSGSSGLDQLFQNINIFGSSGSSVSKALKEVQKHPNDPAAFRKLATAYESKGDTINAISTLQQYTTLRPKDAKVWAELGGLQLQNAGQFASDYRAVAANQQLSAPSTLFAPPPTSKLGKALGTNQVELAAASVLNAQLQNLAQQANLGYQNAVASFQKVADLEPNNSNAQFQLAQAAQTAGSRTAAVAAYRRYLKLNPNSPSAAQIKALIKQLGG